MAYELHQSDLSPLLMGGCFFGSGGGGTVTSAQHLAAHFVKGDYYPSDHVRVVSVEEATQGDAVMVAYMGAPEAINTTLYPIGPVLAAQAVQQRLAEQGRKLAYIAPPESGALGFVVACLVAAKLGLEVIDADGGGRAVPSLPMLTYAAEQVDPRPAFLVSQSGLQVELDVTPRSGPPGGPQHQQDISEIVETMMRPIVAAPEFDEFGGLAMWVMAGATIARALPIRGTLSRALAFGRALAGGQLPNAQAVIGWLAESAKVHALALFAPAELVSAKVDTSGGFDLGEVSLRAGGQMATVLYQNESLLAWSQSRPQPLCMAPDSIAYFVEGPGQAIFSNGDLVDDQGQLNPALHGRRVVLLGWKAEAPLRKPNGLNLDSFMALNKTLGYHGPYVPVDELHALAGGRP